MNSIPIFSYGEPEEQQQPDVTSVPASVAGPSRTSAGHAGSKPAAQAVSSPQAAASVQAADVDNLDQDGASASATHAPQVDITTGSKLDTSRKPPRPERPGAAHASSKQRSSAKAGMGQARSAAGKGSSRGTAKGRPAAKDAAGADKDDLDAAQEELDDLGYTVTPEVVMEVKRRKVAFKAMMQLLEQGTATEAELARVAAPMSGDELQQVSEERSLAGKCGSPLCTNMVDAQHAQRTRWSASEDEVEGVSGALYCCQACHDLVQQYAKVLGDPMQRIKPEAKEQLLISHKPTGGQPAVAAQVNGVTTMLAEIQERDSSATPTAPVLGPGGSGAVEGYVPRSMQGSNQEGLIQAVSPQQQRSSEAAASATQSSTAGSHNGVVAKQPAAVPSKPTNGRKEAVSNITSASSEPCTAAAGAVEAFRSSNVHPGTEPASSHAHPGKEPASSSTVQSAAESPAVPSAAAADSSSQHQAAVSADPERLAAVVAKNIHSFVYDISAPTSPLPSPSDTAAASASSSSQLVDSGPQLSRGGASQLSRGDASQDNDGSAPDSIGRESQLADAALHSSRDPAVASDSAQQQSAGVLHTRPTSSNGAPVKPILKKNSSSLHSRASGGGGTEDTAVSGRKKRVSWADEAPQEFADRAEPTPDAPVLVFTLDGEGSSMEGLLGQMAEQGDEVGGTQVKQLAGRLEVGDMSKLQAITEHQMALAQQVPDSSTGVQANQGQGNQGAQGPSSSAAAAAGSSIQASSGDAVEAATGKGQLPKALQLMFPPAAGGLSWTQKRSQAPKPTSASDTASVQPRQARKFTPHVPSRQAATASSSRSAVSTATTSTTTSLQPAQHKGVDTGSNTGTADSRGATTRPASFASSAAAGQGAATVAAAGQGAEASALMRGAAALLRPRRPKVQLLEHPPDKLLRENPVEKRLDMAKQQQQQSAVVSDAHRHMMASGSTAGRQSTGSMGQKHSQPRRAHTGRPSYPAVVPAAEQLPLQDDGTQALSSSSRGSGASQASGVWVFKSDKEHAAPLNVRKAPVLLSHEDDEDEEGSEQEAWGPDTDLHTARQRTAQSSRTAAHKSASETARGRYSSDGDDTDSDAASDGSQHDSEDEGSSDESEQEEQQEGVTSQVPHKKRSVRADVIYEDEEYVPAEDLQEDDLDSTADGVSAADSSEDEAVKAMLPFFGAPPKDYHVELSPFNLLWSLLSSWITRETLQYINAPAYAPTRRPTAQDSNATAASTGDQQDSVGGEAGVGLVDNPEADQLLVSLTNPSARDAQARAAMMGLLEPHVASLMRDLRCPVPVSEVLKRLTGVLRTLIFPGPLPSLSEGQWRLLALSVLRALAMGRLPALEDAFDSSESSPKLSDVLQGTGFELYHLSALVDLWVNA